MSRTNKKNGSILLVKGINVGLPAEYLDDQSLRESINFEINRGLIRKRSGETALGAVIGGTGLEIMTGRELLREDVKYNVRVGLNKIEFYNTTTSAWVDITADDLTGTTDDLHSTAVPLLTGKTILCITNNVDPIQKWTGTGNVADLGGTPPICKFIQEYKTYLVCANIGGGTDIAQRVQWSDTADPETWDSGNAGFVDLVEDGGPITGLSLFGNYLAVHKRGSIYLGYPISSTAIFQFDRKATGSGTIANNSIVNLPTGEQIFLSGDGLRIFNGVSSTLIEAPINEEIRDEMDDSLAFKSWGVLVKDKDEVWIGIPLSGNATPDTVYKFNYKTRVLYKDLRPGATVAWIGSASAGSTWDDMVGTWDAQTVRWNERGLNEDSDQINIGHIDGTVTRVDETTTGDNTLIINSHIVTKDFQDSQQVISRWKGLELWAKGGSVVVEYSIDGGNTWSAATNSPLTLSSEFPNHDSPINAWFDVVGSKIRFKFSNNTNDEALTIKQFIIDYSPREYRK
jgi:hypothetical protein